MLRIVTSVSLLFALSSLAAPPLVASRNTSLVQQTSDEWKSGNFGMLEGWIVRRIEFHGNATTPDKVLRRAFWIKEGNIFTRPGLERSLKRLNRLGLFERVTEGNIAWQKVEAVIPSSEVDLLVRVEERRRR